jgi:hypothetical protein
MPLLAAQGHFSGVAAELPSWQRRSRWGLPPSGSAAFGTRDGVGVIRPHGRVVREILLQEPGGQFPSEGTGTAFALREGDGRWLRSAVEIEIEGGSSLLEPLLPELFTGGMRGLWLFVHGYLPEG